MAHRSTAHEVLAVVFQVREVTDGVAKGRPTAKPQLNVLLWQRAKDPQRGAWSLPGGQVRNDEDMITSVRRQLAEKVDLKELAHLEQLAVFSDPHRVPGARVIASTFLGLVPSPASPELPPDTRWHPVNRLPPMAFDHAPMVDHARTRLNAKLSYTNIGFALAPRNSRSPRCATSTERRWGIRSTRRTCSGCWRGAASSPRPAPSRNPAAAAGARPRCTGSPTPRCGSPTNSPR